MTHCELFQSISKQVWEDISRNHRRGNRLNEEGITRSTVIGLIQDYTETNRNFNVFAQKARKEVYTGGDLELYIDAGHRRFKRVLLQAKLMETTCCFEHLDRDSGSTGRRQYDTLSSFAKKVDSEAYYLMYNGIPDYRATGSDCAGVYAENQLGCALMDIREIKSHCENNFTGKLGILSDLKPFGRPWRQLSCCSHSSVKSKLYSLDQIELDPYFDNLFRHSIPDGLEFMNPNRLIEEMEISGNNETVHDEGWNPAARIIMTREPMKRRDGLLDI